jgi:hypothetical protein
LKGDVKAIAEFDAHVATIVERGGLSKLDNACQTIPFRLNFESWKMRTTAILEAELWRRCVAEFTRKNGFPPKPGSLWMLSSMSAELLCERQPSKLVTGAASVYSTTNGDDSEASDMISTMDNRKVDRALSRDARKLAKIRDKLEAKDPPSVLLKKFIEKARPEVSWMLHVSGSNSGGKFGDFDATQGKNSLKVSPKTTISRRSSSLGEDIHTQMAARRQRSSVSMGDSFKQAESNSTSCAKKYMF